MLSWTSKSKLSGEVSAGDRAQSSLELSLHLLLAVLDVFI